MANTSKATYTFEELAAILMKRYPGRYTTLKSAKAALYPAAKNFGISDINGKKNYKIVSKADGERMLDYITLTRWNTKRQTPLERAARRTQRAAELSDELAEKHSPKLNDLNEGSAPKKEPEPVKEANLSPQTPRKTCRSLEEYFRALIDIAVKEAFMSAESAAYTKGYDDGFKKGYETAKKDKWDVV